MTQKRTLLVVDDIETNRLLLADHVRTLGHQVLFAEDGLEALEQIEKERPDLVLLDILMPKMDGYAVLCHIRGDDTFGDLPIIMISAIDEMEQALRCVEAGADGYLMKPLNFKLLDARISACLDKKTLYDEL